MEQARLIKPSRAIAIVVSNMIGTGVYTSLGLQVAGVHSVLALLFIWITGGLVALCGALTYGELAARMPKSGGEYIFLSQIFHPALGFMSGFISITIGFAAPLAITAIALGSYAGNLIPVSPMIITVSVIVILTLINLSSFKSGVNFNFVATGLNILLILALCIAGLITGPHNSFAFTVQQSDFKEITSPAFVVSLVYVSFAYSGWNSATYITRQIKNPIQNLPKILITGTLIVMALYTLLNFVFLYTVPLANLEGKVDVAFISARNIFGSVGGGFVASLISVGLLASINSLLIFGPRVTQAIANDYSPMNRLGSENKHGSPFNATILLAVIAISLIVTSTFGQIMTLLGFTLSLFTITSVIGVIVLRFRMKTNGEPFYHTFGYPWIPVFFILVEGSMALYVFIGKPAQSLLGIGMAVIGLFIYLIINNISKYKTQDP
jgi:APA family basic amino acid/polyamine antiporter